MHIPSHTKNRFFLRCIQNNPGKSLGALRLPIDVALIIAGLGIADTVVNLWLTLVGIAGLLSSIVLIIYADRANDFNRLDPQDMKHRYRYVMFWKYPWEFASTMAFIKAFNFLVSGITWIRFDDVFLGACIFIGQAIVLIPEREANGSYSGSTMLSRIKGYVMHRPNRTGAYVMTVGNLVFVIYALSPFNLARFFAGTWNICLNTYLMARASKRLKTEP